VSCGLCPRVNPLSISFSGTGLRVSLRMISMLTPEGMVTPERFESVTSYWLDSRDAAMWNCLFVLPPWLEAWWHDFGPGAELYLGTFTKGGTLGGVAPLLLRGTEASFIAAPIFAIISTS